MDWRFRQTLLTKQLDWKSRVSNAIPKRVFEFVIGRFSHIGAEYSCVSQPLLQLLMCKDVTIATLECQSR